MTAPRDDWAGALYPPKSINRQRPLFGFYVHAIGSALALIGGLGGGLIIIDIIIHGVPK